MTDAQVAAFYNVVEHLRITIDECLPIYGHNDYSSKACPCFDVDEKFGVDYTKP